MKAKRTATAADLEDGKLEKEPKKPPKVVSKEPVAKEGPLPLGGPAGAFSKTTKRPAKEKQLFFDLIAAGSIPAKKSCKNCWKQIQKRQKIPTVAGSRLPSTLNTTRLNGEL